MGGGGCHLLHTRYIVTGIHQFQAHKTSPALHKVKSASNQGKKGQKLIFICSVLSHPRDFGDNKGQKPNIFLEGGAGVCGRVLLSCRLSSCPLV